MYIKQKHKHKGKKYILSANDNAGTLFHQPASLMLYGWCAKVRGRRQTQCTLDIQVTTSEWGPVWHTQ